MKVMIVDDSDIMRRIQRNALEKANVKEIVEAGLATEALDILEKYLVDLIILDLNLPDMNGLECLKEIRSMEKYNNIKIIICTSDSETNTVVRAIKAGANSYIVKPFTFEKMMKKLKEVGLNP